MMNLQAMLLAILCLLLLIELVWKSKLPQKHFLPLVLAILMVVCLVFINSHNLAMKLGRLLSRLPHFHTLATAPFLSVLSANLVLLTLFLILKSAIILFHNRFFQLIPTSVRSHLPGYDFHQNQYFLKHRLRGFSTILLTFCFTLALFVLASSAIGMKGVILSGMLLVWSPYFLLMVELAHYLNGPLWHLGEADSLVTDLPSIELKRMYDVIFYKFQKYFGDYILASRIYKKSFGVSEPGKISELLASGDVLLSDIYNDHIQSVFEELFRDFLHRGTQILVTAASSAQLHEARQALKTVLADKNITSLVVDSDIIKSRLWLKIKNIDIIFMLAEHLEEVWQANELENVLPHLQLVVVPYAAEQPPSKFILLRSIFKNKLTSGQVRLLILSEKYYNIEESINRQFNSDSVKEVQACSLSSYERYLMVWEGSPTHLYHNVLFTGVDYIPPPSVLGVIPLSTDIEEIYWARVGEFDKDSYETMQSHMFTSCLISEFCDTRITTERITLYSSLMLFGSVDRRFMFIYDDVCNLPFMLELLDKHQEIAYEFMNIFSSAYLLRGYFLSNLDFFLSHPYSEKLSPVITWPQKSIKAALFSLYNALLHASDGLAADRIRSEFFTDEDQWRIIFKWPLDWQINRDFLINIFEKFSETVNIAANLTESFRWDSDHRKMSLYINLKGSLKPLSLEQIFTFVIEGTDREVLVDQNMTEDNLAYKYKIGDQLIGQYTEAGVSTVAFYEIRKIDIRTLRILIARDNPNEPKSHKCSICINIDEKASQRIAYNKFRKKGYSRSLWSISFERVIQKVIEFPGYNGIFLPSAQEHVKPEALFPPTLLARNYHYVPALEISLNCSDSTLIPDRLARIAYTLTVVIKESFRSLFPYVHQQLHVFSPEAKAVFSSLDDEQIGILSVLYPDVTDLPDSSVTGERKAPITIWILEESQTGLGVVDFLDSTQNSQKIWEIVHDYLAYKCSEAGQKDLYLYFGMDKAKHDAFPYDFEGALAVAAQMIDNLATSLNAMRKTWHAGTNVTFMPNRYDPLTISCDFCAENLTDKEHEVLGDGRIRCKRCASSAVTKSDELLRIKNEVRQDLMRIWNVTIPQVEETEFRDAAALHAALGQSFHPTHEYDSRAVGLAIAHADRQGVAYRMLIENGAPKMSIYLTIAHELTHIWQYVYLDLPNEQTFPRWMLEGHATYIEYILAKHWLENGQIPECAWIVETLREQAAARSNLYGEGLAHFLEIVDGKQNPFQYMNKLTVKMR